MWSAGQGVGEIDDLPSVDQLIARLDAEYRQAQEHAAQLRATLAALKNNQASPDGWPYTADLSMYSRQGCLGT